MNTNKISRLMRLQDIINITGMSKAVIYAWMKEGKFPKQIQIGARSVAWIEEEIYAWIQERINARNEQVNGGAK